MASSPILYVYYPPENGDSYPGVDNRHITEADWASYTYNQRRTIEEARTASGWTTRKVWIHRDQVDETEEERAAREEAERLAREAYNRAKNLVRYGQIETMIGQLEVLPPADEFAGLKQSVEAVAEVPAQVETLSTTVTTVAPKAERSDTRVFDVRAYGAVGNGTTDDTAALQACADACESALGTYFIPAQMTCRITSQLDLRYIRNINIEGRIKVVHTSGVGVLIGNASTVVRDVRIFINEVSYVGAQSNVAIRAVGLKNGKITINICPYLQLYANAADGSMESIAYTDWDLGKVDTVELSGATSMSWINENRFFGGRVSRITIGSGASDYPHNNNRFYDTSLESSTITFNTGSSNYIRGRFEGASTITFATGSHSNRVVQTYYHNTFAIWPTMAVTDNGFDNKVTTEKQETAIYVPVMRIDSASRTTDTASAWAVPHATRRILPGFRKLRLPFAGTDYVDTGIFPLEAPYPVPTVEGGQSQRVFRFVSDASIWRPIVYVYDANRQPIDGASGGPYIETTGGWTWVAGVGGYMHTVDVGRVAMRIVFSHPSVKYARIVFRGNNTTTGFAYVELGAFVQPPHGTQTVDFIQRQMARPLSQTGTTPPTQSLLQKGASIGTDTGLLQLTHRVDTTLSSAATSGSTTITVASGTGIAVGDTIAVLLADDTTHFTTVTSISGTTVTLTTGLAGAANSGANVATQRWLHLT